MRTVTVEKKRLLETLKINKEKHRKEFLKAQEGFRVEVIEQLDQALQDARDGKKFKTYFSLPAPEDQTPEYSRAIELLDWAVGDTIELSQEAFRQYVLDDWHWKESWTTSNSAYMTKVSK